MRVWAVNQTRRKVQQSTQSARACTTPWTYRTQRAHRPRPLHEGYLLLHPSWQTWHPLSSRPQSSELQYLTASPDVIIIRQQIVSDTITKDEGHDDTRILPEDNRLEGLVKTKVAPSVDDDTNAGDDKPSIQSNETITLEGLGVNIWGHWTAWPDIFWQLWYHWWGLFGCNRASRRSVRTWRLWHHLRQCSWRTWQRTSQASSFQITPPYCTVCWLQRLVFVWFPGVSGAEIPLRGGGSTRGVLYPLRVDPCL